MSNSRQRLTQQPICEISSKSEKKSEKICVICGQKNNEKLVMSN